MKRKPKNNNHAITIYDSLDRKAITLHQRGEVSLKRSSDRTSESESSTRHWADHAVWP